MSNGILDTRHVPVLHAEIRQSLRQRVGEQITKAFKEYVKDVHTGVFPSDEYCYHIRKGMEEEYNKMLKEYE